LAKKSAAVLIIGSLGAAMLFAPMAKAQDDVTIVNIANTKGAKEKLYASVRGWNIVTGTLKGRVAYCTAIKTSDKSNLRLGYNGAQWQLGVPYGPKRGDYTGTMELDGKLSGSVGISDGKWTFLWQIGHD
jgi:hypothetical protein